jgi:hypothetical protein
MEGDQTTTVVDGVIDVKPGSTKGVKGHWLGISKPCFHFVSGKSPQIVFTILPKKRLTLNAVVSLLVPFALIAALAFVRSVCDTWDEGLFDHMKFFFHRFQHVVPFVMIGTYLVLNLVSYRRVCVDLKMSRSIIADSMRKQIAILSDFMGKETWISVNCGKKFQQVVRNLNASGVVSVQEGSLVRSERLKNLLAWVALVSLVALIIYVVILVNSL